MHKTTSVLIIIQFVVVVVVVGSQSEKQVVVLEKWFDCIYLQETGRKILCDTLGGTPLEAIHM